MASLLWAPPLGAQLNFGHPLCRWLVGMWPLNEGGGGVFRNLARRGNGSSVNNPKNYPSPYGNSVVFDGATNYVSISESPSVDALRSNFSVSAWIKPTFFPAGAQRVISSSVASGFGFGTNSTGLRFTTYGVKDYSSSTVTLTTGKWVHIGAVMDSSFSVIFYVDGVNRQTVTGTTQGNTGTGLRLGFGHTAEGFSGCISNVRVYNRAISDQDMRRLYEQPWAGIVLPPSARLNSLGGLFRVAPLNGLGTGGAFFSDALGSP